MDRNISIIVVPHDNSKTWNFRFSYRLLYTFSVLGLVAIIVSAVFLFTYGRVLVTATKATHLQHENRRLLYQAAQIDSLRFELINLQTMAIQIKRMLGVGLSQEDSILVANLSPIVKSPAISIGDEGESVGRDEQELMLKAMPSMWPVKGYVTRGFHITGGEKSTDYHPGIDIAAEKTTPIRSSGDGVIETATFDETYGWMVEIDHGYGIHTLYGHNSRNLVRVSDRVSRGTTIAFLGSTGKSTAPHLHFEVRKNGVPIDPKEYLLN